MPHTFHGRRQGQECSIVIQDRQIGESSLVIVEGDAYSNSTTAVLPSLSSTMTPAFFCSVSHNAHGFLHRPPPGPDPIFWSSRAWSIGSLSPPCFSHFLSPKRFPHSSLQSQRPRPGCLSSRRPRQPSLTEAETLLLVLTASPAFWNPFADSFVTSSELRALRDRGCHVCVSPGPGRISGTH